MASFTGKSFEAVERTTMPMSPPVESKVLTEYKEGYKKFCRQREKNEYNTHIKMRWWAIKKNKN
jgi:hypothetical protein